MIKLLKNLFKKEKFAVIYHASGDIGKITKGDV